MGKEVLQSHQGSHKITRCCEHTNNPRNDEPSSAENKRRREILKEILIIQSQIKEMKDLITWANKRIGYYQSKEDALNEEIRDIDDGQLILKIGDTDV